MFTIAPISKHFVGYLTALNSHRFTLFYPKTDVTDALKTIVSQVMSIVLAGGVEAHPSLSCQSLQ